MSNSTNLCTCLSEFEDFIYAEGIVLLSAQIVAIAACLVRIIGWIWSQVFPNREQPELDQTQFLTQHDDDMVDRKSTPVLVGCEVNATCQWSMPCQHECKLTFNDGKTKIVTLNGYKLATNEYLQVMLDGDKQHFKYMTRLKKVKEDDPKYALLFQTFPENPVVNLLVKPNLS
jgi:hypothetical protein